MTAPEDYYEQEPPLRGRGLFGSTWKQLLADHLRDCYRQRRVFREALNDVRSEVLTETARMHAENQKTLESLIESQKTGQEKIEGLQNWILRGVIATLVALLVWFVTHFGPFASHL